MRDKGDMKQESNSCDGRRCVVRLGRKVMLQATILDDILANPPI
jgi:hypothetical protein